MTEETSEDKKSTMVDYEVVCSGRLFGSRFVPFDSEPISATDWTDTRRGHLVTWPSHTPGPIVAGLYSFRFTEPSKKEEGTELALDDSTYFCDYKPREWYDDVRSKYVELPHEEWRH